MLYEGAIRFLQQAVDGMSQGDDQMRLTKLTHAGEIVLALQSAIDLSHPSPEAQRLFDFYSLVDRRILSLHRTNDVAEGSALIAELREMRDVWTAVEQHTN